MTPHNPPMREATLREWYAGQALAVVSDTYPEWQLKRWFGDRTGITREEIRARAAYEVADAKRIR